jgi:large subunit ribosomal protein L17
MHRHGYQGRKLQREAGQRRALIRGQVTSLVLHEQITTTLAKAKEIAPQFERLVTKAKKGDLHNRRQIRSFLMTDKATEKLIAEIAPTYAKRAGGYTRVVKAGNRRGDNAPMAVVALVEGEKAAKAVAQADAVVEAAPTGTAKKAAAAEKKPARKTAARKPAARKPAVKKEAKA